LEALVYRLFSVSVKIVMRLRHHPYGKPLAFRPACASLGG